MDWPELHFKELLPVFNQYVDTFRELQAFSQGIYPSDDEHLFRWSEITRLKRFNATGNFNILYQGVKGKKIVPALFEPDSDLGRALPSFSQSMQEAQLNIDTAVSYPESLFKYLCGIKKDYVLADQGDEPLEYRFTFDEAKLEEFRETGGGFWDIEEVTHNASDHILKDFLHLATFSYILGPDPQCGTHLLPQLIKEIGVCKERDPFSKAMQKVVQFVSNPDFQYKLLEASFPTARVQEDPPQIKFSDASLEVGEYGDLVYSWGPLFHVFLSVDPVAKFLDDKYPAVKDALFSAYEAKVDIGKWEEAKEVKVGGLLELGSLVTDPLEGWDDMMKEDHKAMVNAVPFFSNRSPALPYPTGPGFEKYEKSRFLHGAFNVKYGCLNSKKDCEKAGREDRYGFTWNEILIIAGDSPAQTDKEKKLLAAYGPTYQAIKEWGNLRPVTRSVQGSERYFLQRLPDVSAHLKKSKN